MPLFAYACHTCNAAFELLVSAAETPVCPACGGADLKRQLVRIAPDLKHPAVAKSWRSAAAKEGHTSNFSKKS